MSESGLSSRMAKLNPFKRRSTRSPDDDDDRGEEVDAATCAGGGHSAQAAERARHELRISSALKTFLSDQGIVDSTDPSALRGLLEKSHISIPPSVTDPSHPLPEYFISSSHNTYLLAHQLYGASSAGAYTATLNAGARCVEIDAWDNDDNLSEPKVTHGYTLVSNIPFRTVCETIRDVVDAEATTSPAPILISLENHCAPAGQRRLAEIMVEVFGPHLLTTPVRDNAPEAHVALSELGNKILVIVEHHIPDEAQDTSSSSSSSSSSEDEDEKNARASYNQKKKAAPTMIIPELAALGVYAQSVKPANTSWFTSSLLNSPHHPLINVSEAGLSAHLPANSAAIARHNSKHLMRVFPKGTRISSHNLKPEKFWGSGAQICAMNFQRFAGPIQINEAMFYGTSGFVLKPAALRAGGSGQVQTGRQRKLRLVVAGATDVPVSEGRTASELKPYLTCSLVQPQGTVKRKTKAQSRAWEDGEGVSPVWDEVLEWEYEETELEFLRLLVKSDDRFERNEILAVVAVRLLYVVEGWSFLPMLDLKGRGTKCSVLVKFEFV